MEFGIFAQLFVPKFERDANPRAEHDRIMALRQGVLYKGVSGKPAHTNL